MENKVPSDADLLQRARSFDRLTLARIYDLYGPGLYRYALRLLGDSTRAEDCVAETFARFLQALRKHKGPQNYIQAYLYRTAHNWIIDQYRRLQPERLVDDYRDPAAGPEETAGLRVRQGRLRAALRQLTADQRQVIVLKFLEDWDNNQVARALDKPVGAIKSLQHRALARLKRILKTEDWL